MISIESVAKRYGEQLIIDDVNLTIPRGGVTAVIGPNGAGKSTLLKVMSRLEPLSAGMVTVDGLDVSTTKSSVLATRLAVLRQENHVTMRLTVRDLVAFGRFPHSNGKLSPRDEQHIDEALAFLGLTELADRSLDELSGGQRQRAFVAMVICQDTDYVLLDEPLNNLDMRHSVMMMQHLRRIALELGKTVVIVLHDINFASVYADRIIAMRDGRVLHEGPTNEIMTSERLAELYDLFIPIHEVEGRRIGVYYWSPQLPTRSGSRGEPRDDAERSADSV